MTGGCRSRTAWCPRCCCRRATTPSVSASRTCPRRRRTPRQARWPLGRAFERFYGFLGGETNQWYPDLTLDNGPTHQPRTPEEGYHLSEDLADQAIKQVLDAHVNAPEKPFLMYYAPGCAHAPHHAPREWADRYAGKFDGGWDAYRESVFARQKELGLLAPTPSSRRATLTSPSGRRCPTTSGGCTRG
jgi:arylsulfatase A-like enzyme